MALAAYFGVSGLASSVASPMQKSSPIKGRPTNPKDALLHWCYMKTRSYVSRKPDTNERPFDNPTNFLQINRIM